MSKLERFMSAFIACLIIVTLIPTNIIAEAYETNMDKNEIVFINGNNSEAVLPELFKEIINIDLFTDLYGDETTLSLTIKEEVDTDKFQEQLEVFQSLSPKSINMKGGAGSIVFRFTIEIEGQTINLSLANSNENVASMLVDFFNKNREEEPPVELPDEDIPEDEKPEEIDPSLNGWVLKNNIWYYYINGIYKTGWLNDKNIWYYLKEDGAMATGWIEVDGARYFLGASGAMATGWIKNDGKWYYLASSGAAVKGWLKDKNTWYYLKEDYEMATGWIEVDGARYFLGASGAMVTGWLKNNNKWYYLASSGAAVKGWLKDKNIWYYLKEDGEMATGWIEVNGARYFLGDSGAMATGWLKNNSKWYYLNPSGDAVKGWKVISDIKYYFNEDNEMVTGWLDYKGKWYYLNSSGAMETDWIKLGYNWYFLNENGVMLTDWHQIRGKWYYFYKDGHMAKNEMIGKYQVGSDGSWINTIVAEKYKKAEAAAKAYVGKSNVGVYVMDIETGTSFGINENKIYQTASTAKLSAIAYTQKRLNEGSLKLSTSYRYYDWVNDIPGRYQRGGSGILQGQLREGDSVTVERLLKAVCSYSDNLGSNMLAYYTTNQSDANFRKYIKTVLGREIINYTKNLSPKDLVLLMLATYKEGGLAIESLKRTAWDDVKIPKYIPVTVAHKIGIHDEANCDVAVVYTDRPYLVAIMTPAYSDEYISKLSKVIYDNLK